MSDPSMTGGCLCGGVRFELTEHRARGRLLPLHPLPAPNRDGGSAQARIDGRTLRVLQGEDLLKGWRHPDGGHEKCFCGECGAHLFSRSPEDPTQVSVRMGAFDGDPGVRPSWRTYVAYAAPWEPIPDDGWSASPRQSRSWAGEQRTRHRSDLADRLHTSSLSYAPLNK